MVRPEPPASRAARADAAGHARPVARVEVAYALPDRQRVVALELPDDGLTALQAVQRSGLLQEFPEIREHTLALAVFGVVCAGEHALRAGDRVEILRPLRHDPRTLRRERAASARRPPRRR